MAEPMGELMRQDRYKSDEDLAMERPAYMPPPRVPDYAPPAAGPGFFSAMPQPRFEVSGSDPRRPYVKGGFDVPLAGGTLGAQGGWQMPNRMPSGGMLNYRRPF